MKRLSILLLVAATLSLASCDVEFSPNAQWKETPVVYCLLDQDDDTTWARVERCYLGDGDIYQYSTISDSINYPVGTIAVWLVACNGQGGEIDSLRLADTLIDRMQGSFAYEAQPAYCCRTRGWLREDRTYRLRVRRTADGTILAESQTAIPLVIKNASDSLITKPYSNRGFAFKDGRSTCEIAWNSLANARRYQPMVRMYYAVDGDTLHIDANCPGKAAENNATTYTISYQEADFLESVRQQLKNDPRNKFFVPQVDIYLHACSEDLNAYIFSVGNASASELSAYSNISGGLGIFAARRLKLYKRMPADQSINQNGLLYKLKQLEVGF